MRKRTVAVFLALCWLVALCCGCGAADGKLTKTDVEQLFLLRMLNLLDNDEKSCDDLQELFDKDFAAIDAAVRSGRYEDATKLDWIEQATEAEGYVDFYCGGSGMGSQTNYTGFFYTPDDDPLAMWRGNQCGTHVMTAEDFVKTEEGWEYRESGGDNVYRVCKLADGYYYYYLHF